MASATAAAHRALQVDELIDRLAREEFAASQPGVVFAPICIVIAAYKEKDNIEAVLQQLPSKLCGLSSSVLVVIDGEDDGTGAIVREHGGLSLIAPVNRGQGAALRLGYRVASEQGAKFLVTADADGQTDPSDLERCLAPVVSGEADFVNGSRRLGTTHSRDLMRNTGVVVFSELISLLTRTKVTDSANPVRAMRADLVAGLRLEEPQYQASELLIGAIMSGARVIEVPVTMRKRASGTSKKGGNLLYGCRYGRVLLHTYRRERSARRAMAGARGPGRPATSSEATLCASPQPTSKAATRSPR